MAGPFFQRLRDYYSHVAAVLRGEANVASIFPNTTDIGMAREHVYAEFLHQHAPSKCNVFFGGFLFGEDGEESKQLDVLVTTDTTPRYNFHNKDGHGKSFSSVDGTLGVASIKSRLDKRELEDALSGLASIPENVPLEGRVTGLLTIENYDDWPYKIIYASDGISPDILTDHMTKYYLNNSTIPLGRRPNMIHVAGKYVILRVVEGLTIWDIDKHQQEIPAMGEFHIFERDADRQALIWAINSLQQKATASNHIIYSYGQLINLINGLPKSGG